MKQQIIKKDWDYSLYEDDSKYILTVVCGSVATYEIKIELNEEERTAYEKDREVYIDKLAKEIQFSPSSYSHRNI